MDSAIFRRNELLLGSETMERIAQKRVIIFGVGGVGSWCAESLVRSGISRLTIVDSDCVSVTNINRQLMATTKTVGQVKVDALKERLLSINPEAEIKAINAMYEPTPSLKGGEDLGEALSEYDYIIDAIDSVAAKTDLIIRATRVRGLKVFSSMGAALRFDPTQVTTGELMSIKGDALAKAVRARMKKIGLKPYKKVKCVYSTEQAVRIQNTDRYADRIQTELPIKGSLMQVTAVFGCTLASMVIEDIRKGAC